MKKDIEVVYLKEALKVVETLINLGVTIDTLMQVTKPLNKGDLIRQHNLYHSWLTCVKYHNLKSNCDDVSIPLPNDNTTGEQA
jgi:hypothetical protein